MKGYKGFDKGLICKGKQYAENTIFEEDEAIVCKKGMHFCENPFDVLDHYPFVGENAEINDFADVEALDNPKTNDNHKFSTTKLKVGAKIGINGLVNAFVDFTIERVKKEKTNTGDYSAATVGKGGSVAIVTGYDSKAKASIGSAICICERGEWNGETYPLLGIKAAIVDGEKLKADTFYKLVNGEFVEV